MLAWDCGPTTPSGEINTVAPTAVTGPLVPQGPASAPHTSIQLDLTTRPPGPCSFLSQGLPRGCRLQDNGLGRGGQRGECVATPTPTRLQKGPLVPGSGWGGKRAFLALCVCVCPSVHPCPCPAGPNLPGLLFWPQATTQVLGVLGVVPNEVNLREDQSPGSSITWRGGASSVS